MKIVFVNAYNDMSHVFPEPSPAQKEVPSWYKKQPSYFNNEPKIVNGSYQATVKKCQAIFDSMTAGYYLKCPIDIYIDECKDSIEVTVPPEFNFMKPQLIASHAKEQISHYPIDLDIYSDKGIIRIHPAWMPSTPLGYSTLYLAPLHSGSLPITAVPAIVDTDSFIPDGHLSFFVKKGFTGVIKQGTPIAQLIPFKRESWDMEIDNSFSLKELIQQRRALRSTFINGYRMKFWSKKNFK